MQTEADAFLQRIRAYPDDDSPRLIFADWLEEQEERIPAAAARARFIRVQIALARIEEEIAADPFRPNPGRGEREETRLALQAEDRALRDSHGDEWTAPFRRFAQGPVFHRGFVEEVKVSARDFLRHADELFGAGPIRCIDLLDIGGNLAAVLQNSYLSRLNELKIHASYQGEVLAQAITRAQNLSGLKSLELSRNRFEDDAILQLSSSPILANLEELDLKENEFGETGARALAASPHLGCLRKLELKGNRLGPGGAEAIAGSERLAELRSLGLARNEIGNARLRSANRASELLRIPVLDLSENGLNAAMLQLILTRPAGAAAPEAVRLTDLTLSNNDLLGNDGARVLARCPDLARLQVLRLARCDIGDEGARAIAESPHLNNVVILDLANNPISDSTLRGFLGTPHMRSLRELAIPRSGLTADLRRQLFNQYHW
ncbi:MAG TPA: TIGR02996 domain-containing protein [Gemmata sp.]|nr:TIGR02996 domain-containing protein [Gemmata sp.]